MFQQQSGGGGGRSLSGCQDAIVPVSPDTDSVPDRLTNSTPFKKKRCHIIVSFFRKSTGTNIAQII